MSILECNYIVSVGLFIPSQNESIHEDIGNESTGIKLFLNLQEAPEVAEERVDAMLALRRAEERRLAGSEVCARDWTPAGRGEGIY